MRVAFKIVTCIALGVLIFLGVVLFVQEMPYNREVSDFGKKFKLVQIGDPEIKVISVLGKPDVKEKEFRLGQKEGFENAYEKAKDSDSQYYLLWFKGVDVVFAVGINNHGQVSVKESGGT